MGVRTDIAVEFMADKTENEREVKVRRYDVEGIEVTNVEILNDQAAKKIGKPMGKYVTLEAPEGQSIFDSDMLRELLIAEIRGLVGNVEGDILVVGIGNKTVTPDALGPKAAERVFATRHISEDLRNRLGLTHMASVSVICPGVLGQTGIETKEIIEGAVERVNPKAIIMVDALAAREVSRLGRTVQLSDTGLAPGSGVGNSRTELSEKNLGVKCVTVGVPTVVDASTLSFDLTGENCKEHEPLIVTPRDIDRMIAKLSEIISYSINVALQPENAFKLLSSCV